MAKYRYEVRPLLISNPEASASQDIQITVINIKYEHPCWNIQIEIPKSNLHLNKKAPQLGRCSAKHAKGGLERYVHLLE